MNNQYKGRETEKALDDALKEVLLKDKDKNFPAIEAAIESSDKPELETKINKAQEHGVIEKLRERTGIKGIGLAGTQMLMIVLTGLNIF